MNPVPDPAGDRTSHFVQDLNQVRGLDGDLSLAIAYDHGTHLAMTAARDIHQTLRAVLGHAQDINRARTVAACLTRSREAAPGCYGQGRALPAESGRGPDLECLIKIFAQNIPRWRSAGGWARGTGKRWRWHVAHPVPCGPTSSSRWSSGPPTRLATL